MLYGSHSQAPLGSQATENAGVSVEGYSATGSEEEQWLRSYERAAQVREYLTGKFRLERNYVGVMPMGAVPAVRTGKPREGVSLVFFFEKSG